MKKQASNLLKLAVVAGFMTGAAAKADDHAKHDAKAAGKGKAADEKHKCVTCEGEKKAKALAEKKAKSECGAATCATHKEEKKKK